MAHRLGLAAATLVALVAQAWGLTLVEEGKPRAEIVAPAEMGGDLAAAAADLQAYVERMSGARLPIRPQKTTGGTAIVLRVGVSGPSDVGYRLRVEGDDLLIEAYITQFGMRPQMLFEYRGGQRGDDAADFTLRIIQPAKQTCSRGTGLDTGRCLVSLDPMVTPGTFVRVVGFRVDKANIHITGLYVVSTPPHRTWAFAGSRSTCRAAPTWVSTPLETN